ncbi:MAG: LptF/LptG family permease, partial [Parachlamydiaceae bacterium]|nr:LptF/LptG family permease [Parachlamydiaceae bacterium]
MFLTKIWERYFLRQMTLIFVLFLFGFYALYTLIDYSNHAGSFKHHHFSVMDIARFYGYEFITRMDVLVPFAILIAFIKTVSTCNANNELVALMASGIPLKKLMKPFIAFALLCTSLIYFNTEILQPYAVKNHNQLGESRAKKKQRKYKHAIIQQIALKDGSSIVFQRYETASQRFYDAYWIRNIDDIYRIKYLSPYTVKPLGEFVEHLQRNQDGNLLLTESFDDKIFDKMQFDKKTLLETVSTPSELSITALKEKLPKPGHAHSQKEAQILTLYYYKLAFPWLCLLSVLAPAPFCTRFSRNTPLFFIYAGCIFALVAFYIILDAAVILG